MPAPVPIQVRYTDAGLLGRAAASAGEARGRTARFEAQAARDDQFLSDELDRRAQLEQASMEAGLQERAMQLEALKQRNRSLAVQSPTRIGTFTRQGRITPEMRQLGVQQDQQEAEQQRRLELIAAREGGVTRTPEGDYAPVEPQETPFVGQPGVQGVGGATLRIGRASQGEEFTLEPDGQITGRRGGFAVPQEEIQRRTGAVSGAGGRGQAVTPAQRAKGAYVDSISRATNLPPAEVEALRSLASSSDASLSDVRIAAQQAARRQQQAQGGLAPKDRTKQLLQEYRDEEDALRRKANQIEDMLLNEGIDPTGREEITRTEDRFDFGTGLRDREVPAAEFNQLRDEYQRLLKRADDTRERRRNLIEGDTPPSRPANDDPLGILE